MLAMNNLSKLLFRNEVFCLVLKLVSHLESFSPPPQCPLTVRYILHQVSIFFRYIIDPIPFQHGRLTQLKKVMVIQRGGEVGSVEKGNVCIL